MNFDDATEDKDVMVSVEAERSTIIFARSLISYFNVLLASQTKFIFQIIYKIEIAESVELKVRIFINKH